MTRILKLYSLRLATSEKSNAMALGITPKIGKQNNAMYHDHQSCLYHPSLYTFYLEVVNNSICKTHTTTSLTKCKYGGAIIASD